MTFLPDPAEIRRCLVEGFEDSKSLDAAVAFIGIDWADLIGTFSGQVRVVACPATTLAEGPLRTEQGRTPVGVFWPPTRIMHPWPTRRFAVNHPR